MAMSACKSVSFPDLLRRRRVAAGLTQEALAELAGVSTRGISDIERGIILSPHRDTVQALAAALALDDGERALFESAARRPARALSRPAPKWNSLPIPPTPLIGRETEVRAVCHQLRRTESRLLTLVGPGGGGKTRLALRIASDLAPDFAGGVRFVPLASVTDSRLVGAAVLASAGGRRSAGESFASAIARALGGEPSLLVVDNFEQVIEAAALLSEVLAACSGAKVLVTSRIPLSLRGEYVSPVPPLPCPPPTVRSAMHAASDAPASRLFVERARAANPSFALSDANAGAVGVIVNGLDGLPLAIELAAAWTNVLSAAEIASRLDRRLSLLVDGPRDAPERHRTMQDAIAWSYDLLSDPEQRLFRTLGVFSGGFDVGAVTELCRRLSGETSAVQDTGGDLLRQLGVLISASLVHRRELPHGTSRYGLLETVREFARAQLERGQELLDARSSHAELYAERAGEAGPNLVGPNASQWLDRLETDHDNLRTALGWLLENGRPERAGAIAGAIWRFWQNHGHLDEGRGWFRRLREAGDVFDEQTRARCLIGDASLALRQGAFDDAGALANQAIAAARTCADSSELASALNIAGIVAEYRAEYPTAERHYRRALRLRRKLGDTVGVGVVLGNLGIALNDQGQYAESLPFHEEALTHRQTAGDDWGIANSLLNLGIAHRGLGDLERAYAMQAEARTRFQEIGDAWGVALCTNEIGAIAEENGRLDEALEAYRAGLELRRAIGDRLGIARGLESLGRALVTSRDVAAGVRLLAAGTNLRAASGAPLPTAQRPAHDRAVALARESLGASEYERAWAAGSALTADQAVAEGLSLSHAPRQTTTPMGDHRRGSA